MQIIYRLTEDQCDPSDVVIESVEHMADVVDKIDDLPEVDSGPFCHQIITADDDGNEFVLVEGWSENEDS